MKLYLLLLSLSATFLLGSCKTIRTRPCKNWPVVGTTTAVEVIPCPVEPCILHKGNSSTIKVHFTPNEESTTLKIMLKGYIGMIWIPFPLSDDDVCDDSEGSTCKCPLEVGQNYIASKTIPVSTSYPSIRVPISVQLENQNGDDVTCVEFPVVLQ